MSGKPGKGWKGAGMEGWIARWYARTRGKDMEQFRQAARALRDDFRASGHCVEAQLIIPERLVIEVSEKPLHQLDLRTNIVEPAPRRGRVRTHR